MTKKGGHHEKNRSNINNHCGDSGKNPKKERKMKFFTRFNPPAHAGFDQTGQESMTKQSEKDSCDINMIMDRFNRSGKLPRTQPVPPRYIDATGADYQRSLEIVREAKEAFSSLPSKVRQYFNHNPAEYLQFFEDPKNIAKGIELGIMEKKQPSEKEILAQIAKNTVKEQIISDKDKK